MSQFGNICKSWWPTAAVVIVILYATWFPSPIGSEELPAVPFADKWIHAIFGGGLLGAVVFDYTRSQPRMRYAGLTVLCAMLMCVMAFMAIDEMVQGALPIGRPSDALDLLADWAGAFVGFCLAPPAVRLVLRR